MTTEQTTVHRAGFESCTDDSPHDEAAWSTVGHFDPSISLLVQLARAISYETGYSRTEVVDLLHTVRWSTGYVGKLPNIYDLVACDEEGIAQSYCDDDGEEITCTDVQPCTWAVVKLDARGR